MARFKKSKGAPARQEGAREHPEPTSAPTPPEGHREHMEEVPLPPQRYGARVIPILAALVAGIAVLYALSVV